MLLITWLVQLALLTLSVSAFYPWIPCYREDGVCPDPSSKRDVEDVEVRHEVLEMPTLKIKRKLPMVWEVVYTYGTKFADVV
jgi:hypothetical protein